MQNLNKVKPKGFGGVTIKQLQERLETNSKARIKREQAKKRKILKRPPQRFKPKYALNLAEMRKLVNAVVIVETKKPIKLNSRGLII